LRRLRDGTDTTSCMHSRRRRTPRRYTIVIADRKTGVYRRFTLNPRPVFLAIVMMFTLPVLMGLGLRWSASADITRLRTTADLLDVENRSYRAATGTLTGQIESLQAAIAQLDDRSQIDPKTARAIERLPAAIRNQAAGGPAVPPQAGRALFLPGVSAPDDTFGMLRDLLYSLENGLRSAQAGVERRQALAGATPSIWPAHGWLTASFGNRSDPFTGQREFLTGLDISADKGQPVFATANGTVQSAGPAGAYGTMVVLDHGFGLTTRYAHLSRTNVAPGETVARGDVIGFAGSTGRATGDHVHYEVLANGQMLNPLRFLLSPATP
jgi:murein DD-endopeptidase MepM/ murein hydrolase activator NlpD